MLQLSNYNNSSIKNGVRSATTLSGKSIGTMDLWFEVSPKHDGIEQGRADPFILPALLISMFHGEDLEIVSPISDRLAVSLPDIAKIFSIILQLREPKIEISNTVHKNDPVSKGVLTGISGGVDSFHIIAQHFIEAKHESHKVTHVVFNDVGSHGTGDYFKVMRERLVRVQNIAEELGLTMFKVKSNFADVLGLDFQKTHTARNVSAAYMFTGLCGMFLYATNGNRIESTGIRPLHDMALADQVLLPLFSTDQLTCIGPDARLQRTDKTALIAHLPIVQKSLDVCQVLQPAGTKINCSRCRKCVRTLVTLDCLGMLDKFEAVFHIDHYLANRDWMVRWLIGTGLDVNDDAVKMAIEHGLGNNWLTQLKLHAPWLQHVSPHVLKKRFGID